MLVGLGSCRPVGIPARPAITPFSDPELAEGKPKSIRSELYSLAMCAEDILEHDLMPRLEKEGEAH